MAIQSGGNGSDPRWSTAPDDWSGLAELSRARCEELTPTHVYVAALMVVGTVGNVSVCAFYSRRHRVSPTTRLIVALALVDLLVCVLMPKHVVINCRSYRGYSSTALCGLSTFFNFSTSLASGFILVAIAVFRFRAVCRYYDKPYSMRQTNAILAVCVVSACVVSVPVSLVFESVYLDLGVHAGQSITGSSCMFSDDPAKAVFVSAVCLLLSILFSCTFIIFIVLYSLTCRKIVTHFKKKTINPTPRRCQKLAIFTSIKRDISTADIDTARDSETDERIMRSSVSPSLAVSTYNNVNSVDGSPEVADEPLSIEPTQSDESHSSAQSGPVRGQGHPTLTLPQSAASRRSSDIPSQVTRRVLMCFTITVVFILSFLPYLVVSIHGQNVPEDPRDLYTNWKQICLSSYLLNSALNPIVYAVFNVSFRNFVMNRLRQVGRKLACVRKLDRASDDTVTHTDSH